MSLDYEWIPAPESASRQVMVVLHGLGDSSAGFHWLPAALRLPSMNYLLANAPDSYYGGYSWYDIYGDSGPGVARSGQAIAATLDDLVARGFPSNLTTIFGFSQGCVMTIEMAARYPRRFAGLVGVSGYVHEPEELVKAMSPVAKEQRILFTHGSRDPVVSSTEAARQVEILQKAGMRIEWRVFSKAHEIAGEEEIQLIREFTRAGLAPVAESVERR
jgi:phospholipase/carboxylesterase